ncbi:sensor histidine kinase [Litchfieldia alkalitelluris]|uniref:sensor histidine kinase n=1 Tax=Litchfieldia alkalitelluris TaxID=304268 RepID=UPI001F3D637B|nr:sensor histidine kinase [Litchfieldia alkalitelluris]
MNNQYQTTRNHLETSSEVADLLFRNIINMQRLISWSQEVREELITSSEFQGEGVGVLDKGTTERIQDLLSNYLIDTQYIDSVCLFDVHFRTVCYGNSKSIGQFENGVTYKGISKMDWYRSSVEAKGRPVFFNHNVLSASQSSNTFSSVKLLKDPNSLFEPKVIGLLVVNVKKSMFSRVFNESNDSTFIVADPNGRENRMIYQYPPTFNQEFDLERLNNSGFITNSYKNQTTGWVFTNVINEKELLEQPNQIGVITTSISLVIAVFVLYFSFVLSGKITRPLLKLKNMTIEWAKGFWNQNETTSKDDISVIGETFQRITIENKELNEQLIKSQLKEREAELRALQAQIKPHFLYNTLDSIYWMAVMDNNQDIAKIAVALSKSFKLSLNSGEDLIPLSSELEHISHYITIQNIRFHNRFHYEENVATELKEMRILKLLLQPIVENAIYHGLESKIGEGTIKLTGNIEKEWVIFTISDDGVGIEDLNSTKKGYGLTNVIERLQLYYGPESSLTIFSKVHEGTNVEIRFPIDSKGG